ncbi:MAG: hypothetical protein KDL10_03580, partial [Kiritimatiellae bacterium]|nr:hypothetical protein [Kiritimatiellia bacterium]
MVYLVPIGSQKKCCVQDVDWSNPTDKASDLKRFLARRYVDCGPSLDVTSADDSYQITMFGRCYRILINDDYNTLCVDSCRLVRQALLIHHFSVESRNFGMFFDYEFSSKSKGYLILDKIGHDLVNKKIKFSLDDDMKDEEISDALHQLARHVLEYCLPDEILSHLQGGVEYSVKLLGNDC